MIGIEEGEDFGGMNALDFEEKVVANLSKYGHVMRQFKVPDRGDGRKGKIDIVFHYVGEFIPIEIDRKSPRKKSIFKVRWFNKYNAYVITRSPFRLIKV